MPPRKRANDDGEASTRVKKSAKTEAGESASAKTSKPRGAAAKNAPTFDSFKEKALPIHVSFTHTPPSIDRADETTKPASSKGKAKDSDEGYIGNLTLVPTKFGTGSYGWKGTKQIQVMLEGEDGKKEKVTVQIQINAPVHGSKSTKPSSKKAKAGSDDDDEEQAQASDEE